jgi:hypothetical protein
MGQELLNQTGWVRQPRKYFVATNSAGYKAVRGSADKDYSYCIISKEISEWGAIYSSWSATQHNANRYCKTWNKKADKERYEVVKAELVTAKEARLIKKEISNYRLLTTTPIGETNDNNN